MLVLTRKLQERIQIGDDITITVVQIKGNRVRVGVEAPKNVRVVRGELAEREKEQCERDGSPGVLCAEPGGAEAHSHASPLGGAVARRIGRAGSTDRNKAPLASIEPVAAYAV